MSISRISVVIQSIQKFTFCRKSGASRGQAKLKDLDCPGFHFMVAGGYSLHIKVLIRVRYQQCRSQQSREMRIFIRVTGRYDEPTLIYDNFELSYERWQDKVHKSHFLKSYRAKPAFALLSIHEECKPALYGLRKVLVVTFFLRYNNSHSIRG